MLVEYVCCSLMTANQKRWTLTTANRMLRNSQEDIQFCYDIRGKLYDKYDPYYAVPHHIFNYKN